MNLQIAQNNRQSSPGKRWKTTTTQALEEAANGRNEDRDSMVKSLYERKIANTKTSIRFGNDKVNYVSDARENQTKIFNGNSSSDRAAQLANIKKMKADLTVTNFKLGDEAPIYESTNRQAMNQINQFSPTATHLNESAKEMGKKSSLHFGNERVSYVSVAHEAMEYRGTAENFAALKEEVGKMSTTLRKHNFTFGEEQVLYQSDYNRGFGSVPADSYVLPSDKKAKMKERISEARKCHFTLGHDAIDYQSNTHSALNEVLKRDAGDRAQSQDHAKQMKAALQKTSFIIGDDEDYM